MRKAEPQPSQGSLTPQDILFVVFRHKWKIVLLSLLGFCGAGAVYFMQEPLYESKAKLLVRYVLERSAVDPFDQQVGTGGRGGEAVMNTEIEILTSRDLAVDVAELIGPNRLLPKTEDPITPTQASGIVVKGLAVAAGRGSNVLHVSFANPEPELAREVLRELVTAYFDRHLDIHRSVGAFDFVTEKTDLIRGELRQTEEALNKLKEQAGIINLEESITNLGAQRAKTREEVLAAEAKLAEQEARVKAFQESGLGGGAAQPGAGDADPERNEPAPIPPAPVVAEYDTLTATLGLLNQKKLELLSKYTPRSSKVTNHQSQINSVEGQRKALLNKYPGLVQVAAAMQGNGQGALVNLLDEKAKLAAAVAKSGAFKLQLSALELQHAELAKLSNQIVELERKKELEEQKFRYLESSLEKARTDEALDPSKIPNISIVQRPTVASRKYSDFAKKLMLGLAASGVALGLGLAFLIELILDRSVKRPGELESRLHIPLMLAIPYHAKGARAPRLALASGPSNGARLPYWEGEAPEGDIVLPDIPDGGGELSTGDDVHFILPYTAAIRDRIVYHMELNEMTHKPKLVALTGLSKGAGTTTIAAGLAKAFAEDGGAKVLLVDLSTNGETNGSGGNSSTYSLDSALEAGRDISFKEGEDNLFLARVAPRSNGKGGRGFAPKHLYELMPELRSSEFDYIIFDMPPIGPTSPTVAMAGIMDQVLLVLDAENTNRDTLKRDYADLQKGRADVACVFNKTKKRAPGWVEGAI